ncbi:pyridoxal phosphate-dependent transferase [Aspergillus falconensis]
MNLKQQYCARTHASIPIILKCGHGARVWDIDGNEYIDFLCAISVVNQGHCHTRIVNAILEQGQQLAICTSAFQNEYYPRLCKRVCELLGYDVAASMSSSSEAADLAMKIVRKLGYDVKGIKSHDGKAFLPNVGSEIAGVPVRFNFISDIKRAFETAGADVAAIIIEYMQGYEGCVSAELRYIKAVSNLCQKHNILFIADEIQAGFGHVGTLMAYSHELIKPDMVVLGKVLTGGHYSMSMVLGNRSVMTQIKPGQHSPTFAANSVASPVAIAVTDVVGLVTAGRLSGLMLKRGLIAIPSENRVRLAPPVDIDIVEKAVHDLACGARVR